VADRLFEGEEAVLHVIERIVAPLGLRVDATSPWVDARVPDGSRVQTRFLSVPFRPTRAGSLLKIDAQR
jgi:Flp pilus assembly CpaF family ATPase